MSPRDVEGAHLDRSARRRAGEPDDGRRAYGAGEYRRRAGDEVREIWLQRHPDGLGVGPGGPRGDCRGRNERLSRLCLAVKTGDGEKIRYYVLYADLGSLTTENLRTNAVPWRAPRAMPLKRAFGLTRAFNAILDSSGRSNRRFERRRTSSRMCLPASECCNFGRTERPKRAGMQQGPARLPAAR